MALDTNQVNRILGAARGRDVSKVEGLWVDLQSQDGAMRHIATFRSIADEVASRGDREKAAELLLLLKDDLAAADMHDELFDVLRAAVAYSGRVRGVREDLAAQYRRKYAGRPGLEAVLSRVDLAGEGSLGEAVQQLDQAFLFQEGDYVFHGRGWGVGKVVETNPEVGELVIDFSRRRGQRMEAGMALTALERRSADDLDVLLWTDKDRVRSMATEEPLELLRAALAASGGKLQARELKSRLVDVLDKTGWTKFWAKARKQAKDDPTIEVGAAPRSLISLRDEPVTRDDEVKLALKRGHSFKNRLAVARRELLATRKDGSEAPAWLADALKHLATNHGRKGTPEQRAASLELLLFKLELAEVWPQSVADLSAVDPDTGEPLPIHRVAAVGEALQSLAEDALPPVLHAITTPEYRKRTVRLARKVLSDEQAIATLQAVILDPAPQVWDVASTALEEAGRSDVVAEAVRQVLIAPHTYPEALAAFARARLGSETPLAEDRSDAEILVKTMQVFDQVNLEFKGLTDRRRKSALKPTVEALRALISEKSQRILGKVIGAASEGDVRRILQVVRQSPTLTPTIKRAAEKFVAERFPEMLSTVATSRREEEPAEVLYSTIDGIRRRERELHEILEVKMPEVTIEIGKALDFGDISENAELDAARERQQRLAEQAKRMQEELSRVQAIDPTKVLIDEVRVGTRVVVEHQATGADETYSILGPWDIDDQDDSVISHLSAMARGFLGRKVDELAQVTLPSGETVDYRIKSIDRVVLQET